MSDLITIPAAAKLIGVSRQAADKLRKSGRLGTVHKFESPHLPSGYYYKVERAAVLSYKAEKETKDSGV